MSVVLPVQNGARFLPAVLEGIRAQHYSGAVEVIAVDDGSTDRSGEILAREASGGSLRVVAGPGLGAAAAINAGIRAAKHPLIAQVDQDVILEPHWLERLVAALADETVGAAQGHYVASDHAGLFSRVMALDLRQRYLRLHERDTDHVCTGNSVYRRRALEDAGFFDERLGYGYDNDISYRLARLGYRLVLRSDAVSTHHWREGAVAYARQQYGFGYGRLDLVGKHHLRVAGDDVSPLPMMLHGPAMLAGVGALAASASFTLLGLPARWLAWCGGGLIAALIIERVAAGAAAFWRFRDPAGLAFAPVHIVRDLAWAAAICMWAARRVGRRPVRPGHSMPGRSAQEDAGR